MPNTETAGAGAKPERTPQDYAIEHAEYMAKKAERLLDAINHLNAQRDEGGDAIDSDALTHAEEAVTEAFGAVRNGIYEFRKRRDRAAAQPAGEYPAPHYPSIEDLCARIKAADDAAADRDYMLDSDDCIAVLRGEWKGVLAMDKPERASRGQALAQAAPAAVAGPSGRLSDELRSVIEGMTVSVDVSTGDHDAGHRYFGTVTEVMDDIADKHGVTLLVQDAKPNFAAAPTTQPAPQQEAQEPVAGHCRFPGGAWAECSPEHVRMVRANSEEWKGYEVRYLYAEPQPSPAAQGDALTQAARDVLAEVERATRKFPTWPTDPLHALAVLGEEFGELTKDMLQLTYEPHKTNAANVRTEALQTAAMALRLFMSLDRYEYRPGAQHSQDATRAAQEGK